MRDQPAYSKAEQEASEDEPEHLCDNPQGRGVQKRGIAGHFSQPKGRQQHRQHQFVGCTTCAVVEDTFPFDQDAQAIGHTKLLEQGNDGNRIGRCDDGSY